MNQFGDNRKTLKHVARTVFACAAFLVLSGCETIIQDSSSAALSVQTLEPEVYAMMPLEIEPTPKGQTWSQVDESGPRIIQSMLTTGFLEILPVVLDTQSVYAILDQINLLQDAVGLTRTQQSTIETVLNADAVLVAHLSEYNSSLVTLSVKSLHVETGVVLWSAEATARVGWLSLDIEGAAGRAVRRIMRNLEKDLALKS